MSKNEKHEPYCICQNCKPMTVGPQDLLDGLILLVEMPEAVYDTTDLPETGEWPIVKPVPETRPKPEGQSGCA